MKILLQCYHLSAFVKTFKFSAAKNRLMTGTCFVSQHVCVLLTLNACGQFSHHFHDNYVFYRMLIQVRVDILKLSD